MHQNVQRCVKGNGVWCTNMCGMDKPHGVHVGNLSCAG